MAVLNPLEKKARSSFIKGLLLASFLGILIIAFLVLIIFKMNGAEKERLASLKPVLIVTQDIQSGDEITPDMLNTVDANAEVATPGALSYSEFLSYSTSEDEVENSVRIIAKINIPSNSILTQDMISAETEKVTDDLREQEYNMIVPYANLGDGDTIDIRFRLPSGEDYIVISKKKVALTDLGGTYSTDTIRLRLAESEVLTMSSVIVDAYQIPGSKLYAVKYTDPGLQKAATETYVPAPATTQLIQRDPNIVTEARNALNQRYNETYNANRQGVTNALDAIDQNARDTGIQSGTDSEIATQTTERKTYLDMLYGG